MMFAMFFFVVLVSLPLSAALNVNECQRVQVNEMDCRGYDVEMYTGEVPDDIFIIMFDNIDTVDKVKDVTASNPGTIFYFGKESICQDLKKTLRVIVNCHMEQTQSMTMSPPPHKITEDNDEMDTPRTDEEENAPSVLNSTSVIFNIYNQYRGWVIGLGVTSGLSFIFFIIFFVKQCILKSKTVYDDIELQRVPSVMSNSSSIVEFNMQDSVGKLD